MNFKSNLFWSFKGYFFELLKDVPFDFPKPFLLKINFAIFHEISDSLKHIEATKFLIILTLLWKLLIDTNDHILNVFFPLLIFAIFEQLMDKCALDNRQVELKHLWVVVIKYGIVVDAAKPVLLDCNSHEAEVIIFLRKH